MFKKIFKIIRDYKLKKDFDSLVDKKNMSKEKYKNMLKNFIDTKIINYTIINKK